MGCDRVDEAAESRQSSDDKKQLERGHCLPGLSAVLKQMLWGRWRRTGLACVHWGTVWQTVNHWHSRLILSALSFSLGIGNIFVFTALCLVGSRCTLVQQSITACLREEQDLLQHIAKECVGAKTPGL